MKNLSAVLFLLLTPNIFSVTYWHLYFFHELLYYFLIKNGWMIIGFFFTLLLRVHTVYFINLCFVRNIFPSLIFLPCGLLNNSFKCLCHQTDLFYLLFLNCLDRTPWLQYSVRPLSFIFSDTLMVLLFSNSVSIPSGIEYKCLGVEILLPATPQQLTSSSTRPTRTARVKQILVLTTSSWV